MSTRNPLKRKREASACSSHPLKLKLPANITRMLVVNGEIFCCDPEAKKWFGIDRAKGVLNPVMDFTEMGKTHRGLVFRRDRYSPLSIRYQHYGRIFDASRWNPEMVITSIDKKDRQTFPIPYHHANIPMDVESSTPCVVVWITTNKLNELFVGVKASDWDDTGVLVFDISNEQAPPSFLRSFVYEEDVIGAFPVGRTLGFQVFGGVDQVSRVTGRVLSTHRGAILKDGLWHQEFSDHSFVYLSSTENRSLLPETVFLGPRERLMVFLSTHTRRSVVERARGRPTFEPKLLFWVLCYAGCLRSSGKSFGLVV
jgi:hypothetical protein